MDLFALERTEIWSKMGSPLLVIPAKAGIQSPYRCETESEAMLRDALDQIGSDAQIKRAIST